MEGAWQTLVNWVNKSMNSISYIFDDEKSYVQNLEIKNSVLHQ